MYGWRARIGMLCPSDLSLEEEFKTFVPTGVSIHVARMGQNEEEKNKVELALDGQLDLIKPAARRVSFINPNCIAFACTSGSFSRGIGYDKEIIKAITEVTGVPATTASTAAVDALRELDLKKIAVATPYTDDINRNLKRFLERSGFEVISIEGLQLTDSEIVSQPPQSSYNLARKIDRPDADGVFISCTGFRTAEILDMLEKDLGKPAVSAVQAIMWKATRIVGVKSPVVGYGSLLEKY